MTKAPSRVLSTVLACVIAAGVSFTAATPAKAADPVVYFVGGVIAYAVVRSLAQQKPAYTVIARYCEDTKTGLYHKC